MISKFRFLFFLFPILQVLAQQNSGLNKDTSGVYKLSEVVITATRTNTNTLELANSITVIDSTEISNRNALVLSDLLKSEYGVGQTTFGSFGSLTTLNIRGANAGHTLVLIDGVEMNMPSDNQLVYDFGILPTESIEKIEILRGPQSTLYGSDAVAGVINITTRKGSGNGKLEVSAEGGSYSSSLFNSTLDGSVNKFNYLVSYTNKNSRGISSAGEKYGNTEKDGSNTNNFSSRLGYKLLNNLDLNFFFRYNKAENDLDQYGGLNGDDPSYIYNMDEFIGRFETDFNIFDELWHQKIGGSYLKNVRDYSFDSTSVINSSSSTSRYDGRKIKFDWQNDFNISKQYIVTFGVEAEREEVSTEFYSYSSIFGNYTSKIPETKVSTTGTYLQGQVKLFNSFFTTLGIRYDNHENFGGTFTYRIAPAYIFWSTGTKIKATVGTGFKAPSVFYLYDPVYGNPDLNPERNFGWDVGIEQYLWSDGISIGATYFNNHFSDMIGLDENFKSVNIDKAITEGVEVFLTAKVIPQLSVKSNFTYMTTENKSTNSSDYGMPLLRRPGHKISLLLMSNPIKKLNLNFETIFVGSRDDKMFTGFTSQKVKLNPYTLVNISANYYLFDFMKLFGRIENLFDVDYEEIYGFGTPGISAYGGVRFNID